jgi:hypothetical protein
MAQQVASVESAPLRPAKLLQFSERNFCHRDNYNEKDCRIAIRGYDFPAGLPVGLSPLIRGGACGRGLRLPDGRRCRSLSGRLDLGFGELAPQVC